MDKRRPIAPFSLLYWQQTLSQAWHRFNRQGRALILLRKGQENLRRGRILQAIPFALAGGTIAPEVAFYTVFYPRMKDGAHRVLLKALDHLAERRGPFPETAVYFNHTAPWSDGWVGSRLLVSREAGPGVRDLCVEGWADLKHIQRPLVLTASVDGQEIGQKTVKDGGKFTLEFLLPRSLAQGLHEVEVKASASFVPHRFMGNGDYRPLSFRMEEIRFAEPYEMQKGVAAEKLPAPGKTGVTASREYPLVSIVTPSYNQGRYIEETIQSVLNQDYPGIEHIVVDGGSTDETLSILKRYPHLKWVSEPDRGQSHAINKGFQMAKGEIVAWLNSDDTYLPGAVTAAVEALDRSKGRYIVMGECPFIDEKGNPTGIFHPSAFRTRRDLIKIWKGLYSIPQPTVFFFKELFDELGGLDESLYFAMDYELWLRFSKRYPFFPIRKALATYRLHQTSKSLEISEQELLKKTVEISRRYWGHENSPSYWYYYLSYQLSQIFLWRISNRCWNRSADYYNQRKWLRAAFYLLTALSIYPPMILRKKYVFTELVKTHISKKIGSHFDRFMLRPQPNKCDGRVYSDGWVSDYAALLLDIPSSVGRIEIVGDAHLRFFGNTPLSLEIFLNGSLVETKILSQSGEFRIPVTLQGHLKPSHNELRLIPDKIFIPQALGEGPDKRRLSFIYKGIVVPKD